MCTVSALLGTEHITEYNNFIICSETNQHCCAGPFLVLSVYYFVVLTSNTGLHLSKHSFI